VFFLSVKCFLINYFFYLLGFMIVDSVLFFICLDTDFIFTSMMWESWAMLPGRLCVLGKNLHSLLTWAVTSVASTAYFLRQLRKWRGNQF
jgi:uncharacterized membrane protein